MSLALLVSLAEASLALPSHLARSLERSSRGAERTATRRWFERLRSGCAALFHRLLRFRWLLG